MFRLGRYWPRRWWRLYVPATGEIPSGNSLQQRRRKYDDSRDSRMVQQTMNKKPQTFAATFQNIFTTRVLVIIVGALLGMIASRLITM